MSDSNKHCSVILINWNGWQDTIECLETVLKQDYPNFDIILVDNGSDDDSITQIKKWATDEENSISTLFPQLVFPLEERPITIIELEEDEFLDYTHPNPSKNEKGKPVIYLIKNGDNLGFAKANNYAGLFAKRVLNSSYLYLLNNDTVIEKDCLSSLVESFVTNPGFSVFQSAIYLYQEPSRMWHAGGRILPWMQIKYYYQIDRCQIRPISFVSGCALFISNLQFVTKNNLFSEKYFHGEEDFDFSLRLKKHDLKAATVGKSIVYHKVAVSVAKQWNKQAGITLNFALNRIIDVKSHFPKWKWLIWRFFTLIYFYYLMVLKYRMSPLYSIKLLIAIRKWSRILNKTTKEDIKNILNTIMQ